MRVTALGTGRMGTASARQAALPLLAPARVMSAMAGKDHAGDEVTFVIEARSR